MVYKKLYDVKKVNSIKELMQYAVEENGERDAFRYKSGKEIVSVTYNEFQKDTISLEVALKFFHQHIPLLCNMFHHLHQHHTFQLYLDVLN